VAPAVDRHLQVHQRVRNSLLRCSGDRVTEKGGGVKSRTTTASPGTSSVRSLPSNEAHTWPLLLNGTGEVQTVHKSIQQPSEHREGVQSVVLPGTSTVRSLPSNEAHTWPRLLTGTCTSRRCTTSIRTQ
jgi:hypothetical protein